MLQFQTQDQTVVQHPQPVVGTALTHVVISEMLPAIIVENCSHNEGTAIFISSGQSVNVTIQIS